MCKETDFQFDRLQLPKTRKGRKLEHTNGAGRARIQEPLPTAKQGYKLTSKDKPWFCCIVYTGVQDLFNKKRTETQKQ